MAALTLAELAAAVRVGEEEVVLWMERRWLIAPTQPGGRAFGDAELARARLIAELRGDFGLDAEAIDLVLGVLDQLYDARRELRRVCAAVAALDAPAREAVLRRLAGEGP